ncbi:hypothetical protein Purlil1_1758 [Purpureocillium lilacinum]|uniref:Uncharacterized protein n=1 Tax=Purpureocillium lilacinum TaxID=33203 RepID=A0ABR0CCX0_PURLI|nr:hypothetical protein Purlil1_1758 [Purpureocillium lilacinum]
MGVACIGACIGASRQPHEQEPGTLPDERVEKKEKKRNSSRGGGTGQNGWLPLTVRFRLSGQASKHLICRAYRQRASPAGLSTEATQTPSVRRLRQGGTPGRWTCHFIVTVHRQDGQNRLQLPCARPRRICSPRVRHPSTVETPIERPSPSADQTRSVHTSEQNKKRIRSAVLVLWMRGGALALALLVLELLPLPPPLGTATDWYTAASSIGGGPPGCSTQGVAGGWPRKAREDHPSFPSIHPSIHPSILPSLSIIVCWPPPPPPRRRKPIIMHGARHRLQLHLHLQTTRRSNLWSLGAPSGYNAPRAHDHGHDYARKHDARQAIRRAKAPKLLIQAPTASPPPPPPDQQKRSRQSSPMQRHCCGFFFPSSRAGAHGCGNHRSQFHGSRSPPKPEPWRRGTDGKTTAPFPTPAPSPAAPC